MSVGKRSGQRDSMPVLPSVGTCISSSLFDWCFVDADVFLIHGLCFLAYCLDGGISPPQNCHCTILDTTHHFTWPVHQTTHNTPQRNADMSIHHGLSRSDSDTKNSILFSCNSWTELIIAKTLKVLTFKNIRYEIVMTSHIYVFFF